MKNSTSKIAVIFAVAIGTFFVSVPHAEAATTLRAAAMASANTQKGARYVWGAEGGYSRGYDCSGLIYWSYRQHGKTLPRTTGGQYNYVHHIDWHYRKPGDLVFIRYGHGTPFHVGIYVGYWSGKSWMVNANSGSYRGRKVVTAPIVEYLGGGANAVYGRY